MSLCFFIKDHQDLDHFVPIITFLKDNNKILVNLENDELISDNRINFINKFVEINKINQDNKYIQYFKNQIFKYDFLTKLIFFIIHIFSKIKIFNFFFKNHFLIKKKIKAIICDHRPPQNCSYIFLSKLFKIKILAIPHGYHIFTERIDFAETQKNRNIFDYYTVQTDFQKKTLESLGIKEKKLEVLGSPRFEKKWINTLKDIYVSKNKLFKNENPVLSIFLGHWKYGIDRIKTINLLKDILSLDKYNILLNLHTRGTSELEANEINELKKKKNLIINNNKYHATQVIDCSDVVIGVGTSVLLECITKGKCFFYLGYLQKYKTIFNELNNSQLINSKDDILDKLKNLNIQKNNFLDCKSDFYSKFVKNKNTSLQNLHITFFNKIIY